MKLEVLECFVTTEITAQRGRRRYEFRVMVLHGLIGSDTGGDLV